MSTTTLADLLASADAAGHDHAATEKNSGLQHIHNHATGSIVWFPTWKKFRETSDWREEVDALAGDLASDSHQVEDVAARTVSQELEALLERAAAASDANIFVQENLTRHLTRTWAVADAAAEATGKSLPTGSTTPSIFADYPYDVYAQDGGAFATALWNDIIDARRNQAIAEEAARKALKPVSRKALKNAARKAARR
ncbi:MULTISPECIES: hypothetical protein [Pseudarthrobacter]|jgi:hypothetical protein|uniref:Uncharacterized protein n=1 Tax=Pseudarthrobacter polychromogenes TaxID=1676 RepID=A0ABQ1X8W1_9MICC|nr:hypothetical protein [Pseudarthrobacter polychromogenes]MBD1537228.1 hypothetical protein [Arthrobacter sp. S13_S34]GGG82927.1 hypothetical protein GCM10011577_00340 [Pseudarthrobacter polychromogenes]